MSFLTRLSVLFLVLVAGFGYSLLIPKSRPIRPTAMPGKKITKDERGDMVLPAFIGPFLAGQPLPAGEKEKSTLSPDTGFAKRQYRRRNYAYQPLQMLESTLPQEGQDELLTVSVVTSGSDMAQSIHRPERCMTAQGFNLQPSRQLYFNAQGKRVPITKIQSVLPVILSEKDETGQPKVHKQRSILYYWFVGADSLTSNHYTRTIADLVDRLKTGTDQQWAYASITLPLEGGSVVIETPKAADRGERLMLRKLDDSVMDERGLTEADRVTEEFINDFIPELVDEKMVTNWNR